MNGPSLYAFDTHTSHSYEKLKIVLVIGVLVLISALFLFTRDGGLGSGNSFTSQRAFASAIDLSRVTGSDRLPEGFPRTLPVETQNLHESVTIEYPDKNIILHSVVYGSPRQLEDIRADFERYFAQGGYRDVKIDIGFERVTFQAYKGSDTVSVVLSSPKALGTNVQIGYVQKK